MNNPELLIIKLLLNKNIYNKYKEYIDISYIKEYYRDIYYIYNILSGLHEKTEGSLNIAELTLAFYAAYPDADRVLYESLFRQLEDAEIGEELGGYVVGQIIARKRALKLSELAFQVAQGFKSQEDLQTFLDSGEEIKVDHALPLDNVTDDLEVLIEDVFKDEGLRWRLDCLNKSLGSLRRGDFGFIFARPETGKTTFLASEITGMLGNHLPSPVVWFNNEEQGSKVMLRIYQAYFGVTADKLLSNPKKYKEEFMAQCKDKFFLFDSAVISRYDIETIVKKLQPGLVIYDQIDKIKGFDADREDLRLGAIYQWARELAKGNHAAIGVCQADGHAEGVRYLTMEHVSNAKTSKQAEADFILGIGKTHDDGAEYVRYLNISKNKLFGDKDSIPDLKHGRFETIIEPHIARYKDVIKFE